MIQDRYKKQVDLLLKTLPEVTKERCFALHGGTAINLFVLDMPRLSVDIDLTFVPIKDRESSVQDINLALGRIEQRVKKIIPKASILHKPNVAKLLISFLGVDIKLEVNMVARGVLEDPVNKSLCQSATLEYDAFCSVPVVSLGQLYGGKMSAALSRQHPRDLFDIKLLLENQGITEDIKVGFLLALLQGNRPLHELLSPHRLDQHVAMDSQFSGMTFIPFSYADYEDTRERFIREVNRVLNPQDRQFLINFKNLRPDWSLYDFERFPAVQWKLQNLKHLKEMDPEKYQKQCGMLREYLNI